MSRTLRCSALFLLFLPALALGQTEVAPAPQAPQSIAPAPVADTEIHLNVVVTDSKGMPVVGLTQKDFTVLDNKIPAEIASFEAFDGAAQKPPMPAEVILLIDAVNQNIEQNAVVRVELDKFLRQNGGHLAEPVSLLMMSDDGIDGINTASTNGNALADALGQFDAKLRTIGAAGLQSGQAERFQMTIKMFSNLIQYEGKKPGRKLMIWLGPGWPAVFAPPNEQFTGSGGGHSPLNHTSTQGGFLPPDDKMKQTYFQAIIGFSAAFRLGHITLYSVSEGVPGPYTYSYKEALRGVKSADQANLDNLDLKVIATQSGGLVLPPSQDLAGDIDRCLRDAGAYYSLSFNPTVGGKAQVYHEIKVEVDQPKLGVRTSTGYYKEP